MREMYTCGYVNSRNSFGAMAGKARFIVSQIASKFQGQMSSDVAYVSVEDLFAEANAKADDMQTAFDMQWTQCNGSPVPENG